MYMYMYMYVPDLYIIMLMICVEMPLYILRLVAMTAPLARSA